jgi:hypothetical protein
MADRRFPLRRLPRTREMAANASRAVGRVIGGVARAEPLRVPPGVKAERMEICQACERFRPEDERCAHPGCGCYLRLKTWLVSERCPAGKW